MKVFLVWSGPRSFEIAKALNDFLPRMIQAVKPFFSNEIDKGAKWANEIAGALEETRFGIVCLTADNLQNTWIHYETGALSKNKDALIWTYLSGLSKGDVPPPLGMFQHTLASKDETRKLLRTINQHLNDAGGESLNDEILEENFTVFWPALEAKITAAMNNNEAAQNESVPRNEDAMLEEILELLRSQQRRWNELENQTLTMARRKSDRARRFQIRDLVLRSGELREVRDDIERIAHIVDQLIHDTIPPLNLSEEFENVQRRLNAYFEVANDHESRAIMLFESELVALKLQHDQHVREAQKALRS